MASSLIEIIILDYGVILHRNEERKKGNNACLISWPVNTSHRCSCIQLAHAHGKCINITYSFFEQLFVILAIGLQVGELPGV